MKQFIKRSLALALSLSLALSLAACGDSAASESASSADSSTSAPAEAIPTFDYSAQLEDNGFWKGVTASELVTLPEGYMGLTLPADICTVKDEDVQDVIDSILDGASTGYVQITDRAVEDGDRVSIDYVGSVDGVEFSGGNTQGSGPVVTAGSADYIDDFLTQIIGHRPGETMDVVVTFPDGYNDSTDADGNTMVLAGKEAVFKTTINYIQGEKIVPELTDEFVAQRYGKEANPAMGYETVAELREGIRADLLAGQKSDYVNNWLTENSTVSEVPASMMEHIEGSVLADMAQQAAAYGMDVDTLLNMQGLTKDDYMATLAPQLKLNGEYYLILQAIAEAEGLEVTEEMGREELGEGYDQIIEAYGKGYTNQVLLTKLVTDHLMTNAVEG